MQPRHRHYYFAYGSNLNHAQMRARCPSARVVCAAVLGGYELVFRGYSAKWGGAVASISPRLGEYVPGVVWSLTSADLRKLDGFEGHPTVYERGAIAVEDIDTGAPWCAWVYVHRASRALASPSREYLDTIRDGYRAAGFDPRALPRATTNRRSK